MVQQPASKVSRQPITGMSSRTRSLSKEKVDNAARCLMPRSAVMISGIINGDVCNRLPLALVG
jgi:hypothetical protein